MKKKKYIIVFLCMLLCGLTACTNQESQTSASTPTAALPEISTTSIIESNTTSSTENNTTNAIEHNTTSSIENSTTSVIINNTTTMIENNTTSETSKAAEENKQTEPTESTKRREAYHKVLENIYTKQIFPDNMDRGYNGQDITNSQFAIYDIDSDGKEELLLIYTATYTAGMAEIVYDYDSQSDTIREQFLEYPTVRYYKNGIIEADWSHNQGLAGRFWPYTMYRYNSETDRYQMIASVDAWDKGLRDTDYEGKPFPDQIDVDGDGLIYYIMPEGVSSVDPIDMEQYMQWKNSLLEDAEEIKVPFQNLTEENIREVLKN